MKTIRFTMNANETTHHQKLNNIEVNTFYIIVHCSAFTNEQNVYHKACSSAKIQTRHAHLLQ